MKKISYKIYHDNNVLEICNDSDKILLSSKWFMEFGKFASEVFHAKESILFSIVKQFQFWKWRMVFKIQNSQNKPYLLISQNTRNTIYKIDFEGALYELKIHYKKKKSIYKNTIKIAELDESFSSENFTDAIHLQILDSENINIVFLLLSCLKIGETDQNKPVLKSQKQLEPNEENWG